MILDTYFKKNKIQNNLFDNFFEEVKTLNIHQEIYDDPENAIISGLDDD
jgi:hypothetical protein